LAIIKQNKHSKKMSGEVLLSQLRDYHVCEPPYDTSYVCTADTPIKWWRTCGMKLPYLQKLAIKLFSVSPYAASCNRICLFSGWIHGIQRTRILVQNLDAIAQMHTHYITSNKSELSHYGVEKTEEKITKIL